MILAAESVARRRQYALPGNIPKATGAPDWHRRFVEVGEVTGTIRQASLHAIRELLLSRAAIFWRGLVDLEPDASHNCAPLGYLCLDEFPELLRSAGLHFKPGGQ